MDIKKIIKEEIDDFDWIRDSMSDPLSVGNLIFISPKGTDVVEWSENDDELYIVIKITDVEEDIITYRDIDSNTYAGSSTVITVDDAKKLIESGYWRVLDPSTPLITLSRSRHFLSYIIYDGNKM